MFPSIYWSLFKVFPFLICPSPSLNGHKQKYGPVSARWLLVETLVSVKCCWLRMLWCWQAVVFVTTMMDCTSNKKKEPFGNKRIRAEAMCWCDLFGWWMSPSLPDRWLVEFVCINAANIEIYGWHKKLLCSPVGFKCVITLLEVLLFWLGITI